MSLKEREREKERLKGGFMGAGMVGYGKRTASVRGGYFSGTNSSSTGLGGSGTSYLGLSRSRHLLLCQ